MGPDYNWCSGCGRSDNDECAKCTKLEAELATAKRHLAYESSLTRRLGEGNVELQEILGVEYPGSIRDKASRLMYDLDRARERREELEDELTLLRDSYRQLGEVFAAYQAMKAKPWRA